MEGGSVAHNLESKERTDDVCLKELAPFSKMFLSDAVRKGLHKTGFVYPTTIQAAAIPLGKSGLDLLVQSKSGTGKTLIFCTIVLEAYRSDAPEPQALIVAPTREIAVQIEAVLNQIGCCCKGFRAVCVIGGLDINDDRKRLCGAKAIVGTPGRLLHLIQNDVLNTAKIRLLVLDEADKMYAQSFRHDLQRIQKALPAKRQTIACSATFCDGLDNELAKIMRNPLLISTEERATLLIGIKQFVYELPEQRTSILEMRSKLDGIRDIFGRIAFKQCLIFAGSQSRADSYCNYLEKEGWPCQLMSGAQDQKTRLEMFRKFREFKTRIIIATDLMSRGVDSEHVNLVINLELPADVVTYLHRIGRAGRFGSLGIAISFVASEKDRCSMTRLMSEVGSGMNVLKYPHSQKESQQEPERDFWDFKSFEVDSQHYGLFGTNVLAPLASQDHSCLSDSQENKENHTDNFCSSKSSINTTTFRIDSKDSALNIPDMMIERPECNLQAPPPSQKATVGSCQSSSQQFPSSNTIDDASSIAADSLRSSQQDISRYQSVLMQKAAIPTLFEFLVDPNSSTSKLGGEANDEKKKKQIDLFDDYKKSVLNNIDNSQNETDREEQVNINRISVFKAFLIDTPKQSTAVDKRHDIYSDYANFNADDSSSIRTEQTGTNGINKETFILSVDTPSNARESIEEFKNASSVTEMNHSCSTANSQSLPQVKHFPSPAHNNPNDSIPDVVPSLQRLTLMPPTQKMQQQMKLSVNVGAQIEIPPHQPSCSNLPVLNSLVHHEAETSPTTSGSELLSEARESLNSGSNIEVGASSGFNESNTTSESSGIATSETERYEEEEYDSTEESGDGSSYLCDPELLVFYESSSETYTGTDDELREQQEIDKGEEEIDKESLERSMSRTESKRSIKLQEDLPASCLSEANSNQLKSNNSSYQSAYTQWMDMYWNQLTLVQEHVQLASSIKRQYDQI